MSKNRLASKSHAAVGGEKASMTKTSGERNRARKPISMQKCRKRTMYHSTHSHRVEPKREAGQLRPFGKDESLGWDIVGSLLPARGGTNKEKGLGGVTQRTAGEEGGGFDASVRRKPSRKGGFLAGAIRSTPFQSRGREKGNCQREAQDQSDFKSRHPRNHFNSIKHTRLIRERERKGHARKWKLEHSGKRGFISREDK